MKKLILAAFMLWGFIANAQVNQQEGFVPYLLKANAQVTHQEYLMRDSDLSDNSDNKRISIQSANSYNNYLMKETDNLRVVDKQEIKNKNSSLSESLPNLMPSIPTGWTDKIITHRISFNCIDADNLDTNDDLYFGFCFLNSSDIDINVNFMVNIYLDNVLLKSKSQNTIERNAYITYYNVYLGKLASGVHALKMVIDPENTVQESIENDNEYIKTIYVSDARSQKSPNLQPYFDHNSNWWDNIIVFNSSGSGNVRLGEKLNYRYCYANWGTSDVLTPFKVKLMYDNTELTSTTEEQSAKNSFSTFTSYSTIPGTPSVGSHSMKIIVDSENTVKESCESDNEYSTVFYVYEPIAVTKPNIVLIQRPEISDKISVSKRKGFYKSIVNYTEDDSLYFAYSIANFGGGAITNKFNVKIFVDNEIFDIVEFNELGIDQANLFADLKLGKLSVGNHSIKIVCDPEGAITESNETDNEHTMTFKIEAGKTDIANLKVSEVDLYPNPSSNLLTIKGIEANSYVSIFNLSGKLLFNNKIANNQIDICNFQSGIYIMKIETEKGIVTKKFIKQ